MNTNKEIQMLRTRNKVLYDELNETKKKYDEIKYKSNGIDKLYNEFNKCIDELKDKKAEYESLIYEIHKMRSALIKNGFAEDGFEIPIYKIALLRLKRKCKKLIRKITWVFPKKFGE